MSTNNDIVKLAVDGFKGNVTKYSVKDSQETLRQALIAANNGNTSLNYRDIRDGKCSGLFTLIEEILDATVVEGLSSDMYFNTLVDFRNVALGDANLFLVEDDELFSVATVAEGTQGIRRQRLSGVSEIQIPTALKAVRIYEEMNRVLSGRVDFNQMITKVATSFEQQLLNDIYAEWIAATADDLGDVYVAAGAYDEDTLLDIIAHVEAAAGGKTATIIGTKKAVRNLKESIDSYLARDEMHQYGVYGTFYGTPVIAIPQRHKVGSTEFVLDDTVLTIIAGDDKPIKVVYEGDSLVLMGDPLTNADLTNEYAYFTRYGTGLILAANHGIGRYTLTE